MTRERRQPAPLLAALLGALLAVPTAYAAQRGYDALFSPEANPATVVTSLRIAMYWRLAVAAYVGGMVAPLVYLAARRDLLRTLRALEAMVLVAAALLFVQGTLLP
jgi:dolichyl-phosphate-mannose--protein O-mannosyl transferase